MSSIAFAGANVSDQVTVVIGSDAKAKTKLTHLLALYLIAPICVGIALLDKYSWHHAFIISVPFRPDDMVVWIYIFGIQHIVGEFQILADKEYAAKYGWRILRILGTSLLFTVALGYLFGPKVVTAVYLIAVSYHLIAQQFGFMVVSLKKAPDVWLLIMKWAMVGVAVICFFMLYWEPIPIALLSDDVQEPFVLGLKALLFIVGAASILAVVKNWGNKLGVAHIVGNVGLMACGYVCFITGYYFFVVVIFRIIHDLSAWMIYIAHDVNRNKAQTVNYIYRVFPDSMPQPLKSIVSGLVIGGVIISVCQLNYWFYSVFLALELCHYYSEAFLWRKGTLLRNEVVFV